MNSGEKSNRTFYKDENGVAIVTVIMISVLLLIACVAILSAVGSHSRNVTDVLSESKAYYAAESGLQSTINVLRGNTNFTPLDSSDDISYSKASTPLDSNYSGDPYTGGETARLSRWLTYNYTPSGAPAADRVIIGDAGTYDPRTGVAYKVEVKDPDDTAKKIIFSTTGGTELGVASTIAAPSVFIPNAADANRIEISFTNVANYERNFIAVPQEATLLTTFNVKKIGSTAVTTGQTRFRIDYGMTFPRRETVSLRGKVEVSGTNIKVTFDSYIYSKVGSEITLCNTSDAAACNAATGAAFYPLIPINTDGTVSSAQIRAKITPVEPYRLQIVATGYGPNGAIKKLEAVIQRNFFNDLASTGAVAMIGPNGSGFTWEPGNSNNVSYCGVNDADPHANPPCPAPPAGSPVHTAPSVVLSDPTNYQYVINHAPPSGYTPPPAIMNNETPSWQQSTQALDEMVQLQREASQPDTYYQGRNPPYFGTYDPVNNKWNGVTFCEGNCELGGEGGGILVVTGKLTLVGNFSFKGLIIVTGAGGVDRRGGGNGAIIGNLVIAPYNPNNLAAGFLPPKYDMRGGGNSDIIFSGSSTSFDGQTAISDFMQGVSEK